MVNKNGVVGGGRGDDDGRVTLSMGGGKMLNSVILYCCVVGWLCMGRRETQNKTGFVAAAVAGTYGVTVVLSLFY